MPWLDLTISCPCFDSFRVRQVAGLFDVPVASRMQERIQVEVPLLEEAWTIGLIVGPSGSGKTTVARAWLGEQPERPAWPADRAVIDCLGEQPIKELVRLLTAVGLSSPLAWLKPPAVLSRGEQFRCELARAFASASKADATAAPARWPLIVLDEFTSVVDRNVARAASAAVSRAIRRGEIRCRLVAITCHEDVAEWLEPDWTLDMAAPRLDRRRLRRPPIELAIVRGRRRDWARFARHHYLTGSLNPACRCFLAVWNRVAVAFCATVRSLGRRDRQRVSRLVTLPDYQGLGIGGALLDTVAGIHRAEGLDVGITAAHPAVLAHCRRSPLWRLSPQHGRDLPRSRHRGIGPRYRGSTGRAVASFVYVG